MTQHTLRTESIVRLTWPVYLQNTSYSIVVVVDFWFFSTLSDATAGAVGQLLPVIWMGLFVIPVFANTGVSVASQYMGAKQYGKVVPAYMTNLFFASLLSFGYAIGLWLLSADIGRWMGMDGEINAIGTAYLANMSGYFVFIGVFAAYNAVLASRGMTHWIMGNAFLFGGINVVLDTLFVFGFGWGVRGVVWASIIGIAAATALSMWLVHAKLDVRFYLRGAVRDMLGVLRPMLRIGVANALEPFSYCVQQAVLSTFVIALGMAAMAANNYASRLHIFQITFSSALAVGGQILMAHWMGARRFDDVHRVLWRVQLTAMIVAFVYSCVLLLFSDQLLGLFTDDPAIRRLGRSILFVCLLLEPARSVNIIAGSSLRAVGDARFPLIIAIIFIWGILPVIVLVDRLRPLGLLGLWICFAVDEFIRAVINLWRWQTGKWRSMGIAGPPPEPAPAPLAAPAVSSIDSEG